MFTVRFMLMSVMMIIDVDVDVDIDVYVVAGIYIDWFWWYLCLIITQQCNVWARCAFGNILKIMDSRDAWVGNICLVQMWTTNRSNLPLFMLRVGSALRLGEGAYYSQNIPKLSNWWYGWEYLLKVKEQSASFQAESRQCTETCGDLGRCEASRELGPALHTSPSFASYLFMP